MDNVAKNRWQVRFAALIIFVLGFAAGILAINVYRGLAHGPRSGNRFDQLAERLNLNADQKTKVQQILSDTREQLRTIRRDTEPRVTEIRRQADSRLQEVMTPDQWQQFQKERQEMRARRGRGGPRFEGP